MAAVLGKDIEIWSKADLCTHYEELLERGLSAKQFAHYRRHGCFGDEIILQSTSGSSGKPLLIPRNAEDLRDVGTRMMRPHAETWGQPPERIALLGGISHVQGALKLRLEGMDIRAFEMADVEDLVAFRPDYLSCYPSIARELVARHADVFRELRTLKLGGEKVLRADVDKIHSVFPELLIVEQLGSTEMPAVAVGAFLKGGRRGLSLQKERFTFLLEDTSEWQPLVVRDHFPGRLFPMDAFYDSGDEVRMGGGWIVEVRRRDDPSNVFFEGVERLLADGCINVQIDRRGRTVYCDGEVRGDRVAFDGEEYRVVVGQMRRLKDSNKLPLLMG